MAPAEPTSATTAWLHTGQPTARNETKPPPDGTGLLGLVALRLVDPDGEDQPDQDGGDGEDGVVDRPHRHRATEDRVGDQV
jgi:hypothetical protein